MEALCRINRGCLYALFRHLRMRGTINLLHFTLQIPPVAVTLGRFFLGETLSRMAWIGFIVIARDFAITEGRVLKRVQ